MVRWALGPLVGCSVGPEAWLVVLGEASRAGSQSPLLLTRLPRTEECFAWGGAGDLSVHLGPRGAGAGLCFGQDGPSVVALGCAHTFGPRHCLFLSRWPLCLRPMEIGAGGQGERPRTSADVSPVQMRHLSQTPRGCPLGPSMHVLPRSPLPRSSRRFLHTPDPLGRVTFLVHTGWTLPSQSFPCGTVSGTCLMEVVTLHAVHFWQGWPFTQNRLPTKPEVPRGPCGQLVSDQKLPWPRGGPGPPTCSSLVFPVLSNLVVSCPHRPAAGGSDHTWSPTSRLGPWWSLWPFLAGDSFSAWGPGDPGAVSCQGLALCRSASGFSAGPPGSGL